MKLKHPECPYCTCEKKKLGPKKSSGNASAHRKQAMSLGLMTIRNKTWTKEEMELLENNLHMRNEDLSKLIGRSFYSIRSMRSTLRRNQRHATSS